MSDDTTDETTDNKQTRFVYLNDALAIAFVVGFHGLLAAGVTGYLSTEILTLLVGIELTAVGTVLYWAFGKGALKAGQKVGESR